MGSHRELSLELGHLLRAGAQWHRQLSRHAVVGTKAYHRDRDLRLDTGAAIRLDGGRAAHAALEGGRPDRFRLCRILPQHAAPGAAVPVVLRAAGNPAAGMGALDEANVECAVLY